MATLKSNVISMGVNGISVSSKGTGYNFTKDGIQTFFLAAENATEENAPSWYNEHKEWNMVGNNGFYTIEAPRPKANIISLVNGEFASVKTVATKSKGKVPA